MNTTIDVYEAGGDEKSWEDIQFAQGCPLPANGEVINLCRDPDKLADTPLDPYRVLNREFYIQRNPHDNTPQMRVALSVLRFEEREYC